MGDLAMFAVSKSRQHEKQDHVYHNMGPKGITNNNSEINELN